MATKDEMSDRASAASRERDRAIGESRILDSWEIGALIDGYISRSAKLSELLGRDRGLSAERQ